MKDSNRNLNRRITVEKKREKREKREKENF